MIEVVPLTVSLLEEIIKLVDRSSLDFFEYKFLSDDELKEYLYQELKKTLNDNYSLTFVAVENLTPAGFVSVDKNEFDSHIFGHACFKLIINVFSSSFKKVDEITRALLKEAESYCKQFNHEFYIYLSLNNNTFNCQQIFNSLTDAGYYFINTLLTFFLKDKQDINFKKPSKKFSIREARKEDADEVAELAEKSFHYSRFHMDPFLDNKKADLLLKTSARNSILRNFVDVMFVAEVNDKIVGYYSAKKQFIKSFNRTFGISVISAVDSNYHGMGIFTQLDNFILNWYAQNCDFTEVGTYLGNYPVHKTWIRKNLGLIRGSYQFSKKFNK